MNCQVCNEDRVPADIEFEGKPVHSWHLSEFERQAMRIEMPELKKESVMANKIEIDVEEFKTLHARGLSDGELGAELGMSGPTARTKRIDLGLPAHSRRGRKGSTSFPVGAQPQRAARREPEASAEIAQGAGEGEGAGGDV